MADTFYRSPTITDVQFPGVESAASVSSGGGDGYASPTTPEVRFPTVQIAREVISTTLDTQAKQILGAYSFAKNGAIQIGEYVQGVSGEVRVSPDGILARNSAGDYTVTIDAATGDATFKGTILAGSVIAAGINANQIVGQVVNAQIASIEYAKITSVAVTSAQIVSLSADKITAGTIDAATINVTNLNATNLTIGNVPTNRMTQNFLSAAQASVSSLSAITANIGTITAGTITGVTVSSSGGGGRIVLDSGNYLRFYDSGGTERARIRSGTSGAAMIAEIGAYVTRRGEGFYSSSSTSTFTDFAKFYCESISPYGNIAVIEMPANNKFGVFGSGQTGPYFTVSSSLVFADKPFSVNGAVTCKEILLNYGQNEGAIRNVDEIWGYNDLRLRTSSGKVKIEDDNLDMNEHDIDAADAVWAYDFNDRSDIRLKKNIKKVDSTLAMVMKLRPVTFEWKKKDRGRKFGLIAQEVREIIPSLVSADDTGILNINYHNLITVLLRAVQEIYEELDPVEAGNLAKKVLP